ncbi:hypothetical protein [Streptomyces sp. NPDC058466]|uniref:hypothetical protein n=1 Tax=Streptomyces sp. NPDC058466 TaxID=3346512 RepID=UPI003656FC22
MAFPTTPLSTRVELMLAGTWTDVTSDVYLRNPISIDRGRSDWGSRVDPTKCTLTFNNRNGKYSPRNPTGALYGQIGRNTPVRVSVNAGDSYLNTPGGTDRATTPDTAALDIVGDIDVRADLWIDDWAPGSATELAGKWSGTPQKSWLLFLYQGKLWFYWSVDGSAEIQKASTVVLEPPVSGRLAVRVTLDVNNGAAGNTLTFYTAPTISGTWTQLGDPIVTAAVTSIFNSTSAVDVGAVASVGFGDPVAHYHAFELRSGIAGSVVANPDFRVQTAGATSFADSTGKTWSMFGAATISNRKTRFVGEVSSWPVKWDVSGKDVYVSVEAAGILRRLGQGTAPLQSTLRRRIPRYAPLAYWPMEEGSTATRAYSPITGVKPLKLTPAHWAAVDTLAGSSPLPTLNSSTATACEMKGTVPAPSSTLTAWSVRWAYRLDTPNATTRTFLRILCTGTVAEWYVQVSSTATTVVTKDSDGATIFTQAIGTGVEMYSQWIEFDFQVVQNGGNVDWHLGYVREDGAAVGSDFSFAGTVGRPIAVSSPPNGYSADLDGMAIGHISVWPVNNNTAWSGAFTARAGETAGDRLVRLTDEESVSLVAYGDGATAVGPQLPTPLMDLLGECADADHGILYEARETVSLQYRDLAGMYNQTPALALNYATAGHVTPPLEPVDDDQSVRNDVTVTRTGGSAARVTLDTGALSTLAPPDGVGRYDESVTLNLYDDDQADDHAEWLLHLGTWDETRYPVLHVELSAAPSLIESVTALDLGDRITISNPPAWLPPDTIDLLAQGYVETIGMFDWAFDFNCTPARPFDVASADNTTFGKADTEGSQLSSGATSTATSISVATTSGPIWTTSGGEMPFDITVAGEVMRVTAISGAASPQTFTVTRSVNGVVKAQLSAADVRLTHPAIVAL